MGGLLDMMTSISQSSCRLEKSRAGVQQGFRGISEFDAGTPIEAEIKTQGNVYRLEKPSSFSKKGARMVASIGLAAPIAHVIWNTGVGCTVQPDPDGPRLAQYCCLDRMRGHRVRISGQIIRKHQFAMSRSCNPQERTWTNRLASDSDKNALSKRFGGRKTRNQYGKERFTKTKGRERGMFVSSHGWRTFRHTYDFVTCAHIDPLIDDILSLVDPCTSR
ncbi:uncharacterized protein EI90DRAFT_3290319 [Cantharellus anzutake]|uniref:uncharacterized protein n=1 Tax=Cantharellus anzutake TaxID=1750568 RepID=UPI001904D254|nr:uncharacterized protein EI90DRAFT_3290319 [Cantharellus anzutake]KAF8329164.1 hypothetical protein EI90DRAFT_3290319 [Cantharellus anzutake]